MSKYDMRAGSLVMQFGPGSMNSFPDSVLMVMGPDMWSGYLHRVHDDRLEKILGVKSFALPENVPLKRFPEWYYCPKCRKFQPLKEWFAHDLKNLSSTRTLRCPSCHLPLVPSRFVAICERGHLDDIPWINFVHDGDPCSKPSLVWKDTGGDTLSSITISCNSCGKEKSLSLNSPELSHLPCKGRHPWKDEYESCNAAAKLTHKGAANVYFPCIRTSLVIPPYSDAIRNAIKNTRAFNYWLDADYEDYCPEDIMRNIVKEVNKKHITLEVVQKFFREYLDDPNDKFDYVKFQKQEFDALSGKTVGDENIGDFKRESIEVENYHNPLLKGVSLIHKVREVRALIGFSRVNPTGAEFGETSNLVSLKNEEFSFYPGYDVRGEGIFLEFNDDALAILLNRPEIQERINLLKRNHKKSNGQIINELMVNAKYVFLHTLSHALIKQLCVEAGYSISSLRERIYCNEVLENRMAGILIYTAEGDSEGTMGGLVRQGLPEVFPTIFRNAIASLRVCSSDPLCSLSGGQGYMSLNLSACHNCCMIPETSCERKNTLLDRGLLVGTFNNPNIGVFSDDSWQTMDYSNSIMNKNQSSGFKLLNVLFTSEDLPMEGKPEELLEDLVEDPDNDEELEFFLRLQRERFTWTGILKNCVEIKVGNQDITCDYFWEKQRILYFSNDQELTPEIIESIKAAGYFVFIAHEMHERFNEFRALF